MVKDEAIDEQLSVTHQMGGMMEFQKTGVYPEKLIIYSLKYEHIWRIKVRKDTQTGTLCIKKIPFYNYNFDGKSFWDKNKGIIIGLGIAGVAIYALNKYKVFK